MAHLAHDASTGKEAEGTPWGNGAIGCAEWLGVPLAAVLERAGVKPGAVDVVCVGGDGKEVTRGLPEVSWRQPGREARA